MGSVKGQLLAGDADNNLRRFVEFSACGVLAWAAASRYSSYFARRSYYRIDVEELDKEEGNIVLCAWAYDAKYS